MKTEDKTTGTHCAQCGAREPQNGFDTRSIIHQKFDHFRGKKYVGKTLFTVCKGTPCGGNLQMAYEG